MTGALYADSQATVKNIIFTIAQLQEIDSDLEFYILHEGTDQLECCHTSKWFGVSAWIFL